jgi:UDP-GlcNAc:undecaprenyl-phosphate GlcNAc-1-phosphate transferase
VIEHPPNFFVALVGTEALLGLGAVEAARRVAALLGIVARPNPIVKSHRRPVPYLGGTAILVVTFGLWAVSWVETSPNHPYHQLLPLLFGTLILAVGTWDDIHPLSARRKFLLEVAVCTSYVLAVGDSSPSMILLKSLFLVSLINAYNLIDVMDGLLCVLASIPIVALLAMPSGVSAVSQQQMLLLLMGVAVLFIFNKPPAVIYTGDAGSLTLGFLIGVWIIEASASQDPFVKVSLVGPLMIPILEVILIVTARLADGRSPFQGSPDHFALRLQDARNWTQRRVLTVTALIAVFLGLAPVLATRLPSAIVYTHGLISAALAVVLWVVCWRLAPAGSAKGTLAS